MKASLNNGKQQLSFSITSICLFFPSYAKLQRVVHDENTQQDCFTYEALLQDDWLHLILHPFPESEEGRQAGTPSIFILYSYGQTIINDEALRCDLRTDTGGVEQVVSMIDRLVILVRSAPGILHEVRHQLGMV